MIRRVLVVGVGCYGATVLAVTCWTVLWPMTPAAEFEKADVIIVFGAGMAPDGTLDNASLKRIARGVDLYRAERAPRVHFTGRKAAPAGPSAGQRMAEAAMALGLPERAVSIEGRSQSTLQNALFSLPDLQGASSAILVSEAFHLPRVAASNWWAGGPEDAQLAASSRTRPNALSTARMVLREGLAWWFNVMRALAYTAAGAFDVDQTEKEAWLA